MNCGDPLPDELISKEEWTLAGLFILAVVIGVVAVVVSLSLLISALPGEGEPADPARISIALAVVALTAGAILFAIFGRWPGSVASETRIDLAASPYEVWDAVVLRDDYPGWKKVYTGIERLDAPGEVYRLHYAEDSPCSRCKLPRNPDRSLWSSRVDILEARRPSFYRQRCFPRREAPGGKDIGELLESEDTAMLLQPLEGGGTRLIYGSIVHRPKMWMAFLTWLGRPGKEHLRSLKAHLDGTPDETLFGIAAKRMAAARQAPARCACRDPD